jgi:hypothetical protein
MVRGDKCSAASILAIGVVDSGGSLLRWVTAVFDISIANDISSSGLGP